MTTYNCGEYISQAIQSVLNQTYKDFELLIIDDGSTDNTEEIIKSINDERIVLKMNEHLGRSKILNYGLSIAKFEWISIMDADDIAHPKRLEKQMKAISGKENELCFTDAAYFKNNKILYVVKNNFNEADINKVLALHGHFTNSTFLFNKNHINKFGGYNEELDVFEDYDLWLRIKDKSKFIFVKEILQFPRIRNQSLSTTNQKDLNTKFYLIQKPYFEEFERSFNITDSNVQNKIRGWREFFCGSKNLNRRYWRKVPVVKWDYRMIIAFIISFFPLTVVSWVKEQKFKLRLTYLFNKYVKYRCLEKEFNQLKLSVVNND